MTNFAIYIGHISFNVIRTVMSRTLRLTRPIDRIEAQEIISVLWCKALGIRRM
jgi:hypothetical protein